MPKNEIGQCGCCHKNILQKDLEIRYIPVKRLTAPICKDCMDKYVTYNPAECFPENTMEV